MCFALRDVDDEKRRVEKGGGAVAGALSASLAPDLPDPDMPHYSHTTKLRCIFFTLHCISLKSIIVRMMIG